MEKLASLVDKSMKNCTILGISGELIDARALLDLPNAKEEIFGIKPHTNTMPDPRSGDHSPFKRFRDDHFKPTKEPVPAVPEFNPYDLGNSKEMGKGNYFATKLVKDRPEMQYVTNRSCYACDTYADKLKVCGKCHSARYCSLACQKKDWPKHKMDCKFLIRMKELHGALGMSGQCARCKSSFDKLKKCSKCKVVQYCSRECQIADWKDHRQYCGIKDKIRPSSPTVDVEEIELVRSKIPDMIKMSYGDDSPVELIALDFKDAARIAKRFYPDYKIETSINSADLPVQFANGKTVEGPKVLLTQIVGFHPKQEQHGIFITDSNGESSFILFEEAIKDPRPHFQWSDLTSGNFICMRNPKLEQFPVKQWLGFMIFQEQAKNIRIIRSEPFTRDCGTLQLKAYDVYQT